MAAYRLSVGAFAILVITGTASAQTTWQNASGGLWTTGSNWSTGAAPVSGASVLFPVLANSYEVVIDASPFIGAMTVEAADAGVKVQAGRAPMIGSGGIVNNGVLTINDTGAATSTRLQSSVSTSITGNGTVRLQGGVGFGFENVLRANSGTTLTIGPDQTIAGRGLVDADGTIIMNGLLDGDTPNVDLSLQGTISMSGGGRAQGTNGGFVLIDGGANILGGQMLGGVHIGGGQVGAGALFTGNNAQRAGTSGFLGSGGIVNNGVLTINNTGAATSTRLQTAASTSITGNGTVRLQGGVGFGFENVLRANSGTTLTIGPDQTIAGRGLVDADGTIIMNGTFDGDTPNVDLSLQGTISLSGGGKARGTNGGFVLIDDGANILGGQMLGGVHIGGGQIGGGALFTGNNAQRAGTSGFLGSGGIVNNGVLTINNTGAATSTRLRSAVSTSITGNGTVRLQGGVGFGFENVLRANTGTTLTIGPDQTIAGRGLVDADGTIAMNGTYSPGNDNFASDFIILEGTQNFSTTTQCVFDFISSSSFDTLTGNSATLGLNGTLELRLQLGFVPAPGLRFRIIDAAILNGSFQTVNSPQIGQKRFVIDQSAGDIDVVWTCLADVNLDGNLDPADFTAWIAAFNAQTLQCDQNGDGSCSPADFTAWIANFNAGCD